MAEDVNYWRIKAHAMFDPLWKTGVMSRSEAYKWLAEEMNMTREQCHISLFNVRECKEVINLCVHFGAPTQADVAAVVFKGVEL